MKNIKISLAVLAALVTISLTITASTGIISGEYSVESIQCWYVVRYSGNDYDADVADQVPDQSTAGLITVNVSTADVDLNPTAVTFLASSITSGANGEIRVATCTLENVTSVCCFRVVNGSIHSFATGVPASFF